MKATKQFVNLIGLLLVVVILVAGVALLAMPMWAQSRTIDSDTLDVAQNNVLYEQQIAQLTTAQAEIEALDADLAQLRAEIAAAPQLDDVHALISGAARSLDIRVESVSVEVPAPWVARELVDADGNVVDPAEAVAPAEAEATPAETDAAGAEAAAADTADIADDASAPAATDDASLEQQMVVTINIDVLQPFAIAVTDTVEASTDADDGPTPAERTRNAVVAARFVDAIGQGPRLISPIDVAYTDGKLVVTALAYFRTEDAS